MADIELAKTVSKRQLTDWVDHVPILRKVRDTIMSQLRDEDPKDVKTAAKQKQPTRECVCYDRPEGENIWEVLRSRDCRYHMKFDVFIPDEKDVGIVYMKIIEAAEKITKEYWDKALVANPVIDKVPND